MDNNIKYNYSDIIFCIKCKIIFKIGNYDRHLKSKNHLLKSKKKNNYLINDNNKYVIIFN